MQSPLGPPETERFVSSGGGVRFGDGGNAAAGRRFRVPVLLLTLAALTSSWSGLTVAGFQLVDWFIAVSLVAALLGVGKGRLFLPTYVVVGSAAILAVALLVTVSPPDPGYLAGRGSVDSFKGDASEYASLLAGLKWLVAAAIIPLLCCRFLQTRREAWLVATGWVTGAAISGGAALTDALGITDLQVGLSAEQSLSGRESGLASHPNILGIAAAVAIPVTIALLRRRLLLAVVILVLLSVGIYLSGSRGSQVGALTLFLLTVVSQQRIQARSVLAIGGVALAAWSLLPRLVSSSNGPRDLLRYGEDSGAFESDSGRRLLAAQSIHDFGASPIWGIGNPALKSGHSIYLQVLGSGGVLLALGLCIYLVGVFRADTIPGVGDNFGRALKLSVLGWLMIGAVENALTDRFLYVPAALLIAVSMNRLGSPTSNLENSEVPAQPDTRSTRGPRSRYRR